MWLLGVAFIQNIVVTSSQHWNGCTNVRYLEDDYINCVPTETDFQMRCFCQHSIPAAMHLKNWREANAECKQAYPHGGKLAVDNSQAVHNILVAFVGTENADMWIGAKTNTLHWNWLPTLENRERKLMSYQGCYDTGPDGLKADASHTFSSDFSLRSECNRSCTRKRKDYMYFTLRQISSSKWECACYKANKFNLSDHDSGTCLKCDTREKIDQGWCGSSSSQSIHVAVYLVEAEANFSMWINGHPFPVKSGVKCLLFNNAWESISCDTPALFKDVVYCALGNMSDCNGNDTWTGNNTGQCFRRLKLSISVTHREAVELCENLTLSLVSLSSLNTQSDVASMWKQENMTELRRLWAAATNLRWQWITGTDIYDGYTAWPRKREQFAFEKLCLAIASTGKWTSAACYERKKYICETVVDIANVTFTTMTLVNTSLPASINPSFTSGPEYTTSSATTTKLVATSGLSSEDQHQSTTDYVKEASNQSQIGIIAGAAVGGLLFLFALIIIAIFLLRRKRQNRSGQQRKCDPSQTAPTELNHSTRQIGLQNAQANEQLANYECLQSMIYTAPREYDALECLNADANYEALRSKTNRETRDYDALQNRTDKQPEHNKNSEDIGHYEDIKKIKEDNMDNYEELDRKVMGIPRNYEVLDRSKKQNES